MPTYNFTDRVRKVLAMAREEAIRLHSTRVETEHILLALLREGQGIAAGTLKGLGVDDQQIAERLRRAVPRGRTTNPHGKAMIALGELPYASRAKKVLEFSMAAAREMNHSYVGTEHLLLALIREEKGIQAAVLRDSGVTYDRAKEAIVRELEKSPRRESTPREGGGWLRRIFSSQQLEAPASPRFAITIDDSSSVSVYEQIIARISEGVATGELRAGYRLPPVRRLADELDIAPGTVARAYSELEQLGVVVTEGARGTRIAEQPKPPLAESDRPETLAGLMRPIVVAAFHLGASASELRAALEQAMAGIYNEREAGPS